MSALVDAGLVAEKNQRFELREAGREPALQSILLRNLGPNQAAALRPVDEPISTNELAEAEAKAAANRKDFIHMRATAVELAEQVREGQLEIHGLLKDLEHERREKHWLDERLRRLEEALGEERKLVGRVSKQVDSVAGRVWWQGVGLRLIYVASLWAGCSWFAQQAAAEPAEFSLSSLGFAAGGAMAFFGGWVALIGLKNTWRIVAALAAFAGVLAGIVTAITVIRGWLGR